MKAAAIQAGRQAGSQSAIGQLFWLVLGNEAASTATAAAVEKEIKREEEDAAAAHSSKERKETPTIKHTVSTQRERKKPSLLRHRIASNWHWYHVVLPPSPGVSAILLLW